jgi:hypothetical protein
MNHARAAEAIKQDHRKLLDKRLVKLKKAAAYADVHPMTMRRYIAKGILTGYRAGPRVILVDLNEIDERLLHAVPASEAE